MVQAADFDANVALPPGLTVTAIRKSIEHIERRASQFVEIYLQQPNVFSAVAGILGTQALDSVSNYEKHKHAFTAQTRFPDLCRRGAKKPLGSNDCLESKASTQPHALQSHYNHEGWYIVWRYLVDPTESIENGKPVIIWRVDVVYLKTGDWLEKTLPLDGFRREYTARSLQERDPWGVRRKP